MTNKLFMSLVILFGSLSAWAWGGRGHATICESAVYLVQNKTLKEYLLNKPQMMGHLCNIPDTYWKTLPADIRKHGDAAHYVDPEITGLAVKDIPVSFTVLVDKYTGTDNKEDKNKKILSVPTEFGTNWWRADQFYRWSIEEGHKLKTLSSPQNSKEEQDEELPYNKAFYNMIVYMGLMGHFVGDNSQPFHTTADYDGYNAGHGGIHAYYEDASVAYFGPDLHDRVVKKAKAMKKTPFLKSGITVIEKMKALAEISNSEVKDVLKLDPIILKSTLNIEKGMSIRTAAKRQSGEIGNKKFDKLIVEQMARSALLLAQLWDDIYTKTGAPEIKSYKSYKYPFTPEFVMPDYYQIKTK